MRAQWGEENLARLAKHAHVGIATIHRIKALDTSIGIDILAELAAVFGKEAWQLLRPETVADELSQPAAAIGRMFDRVPDGRQAVAFALVSQLLEFENTGPGLPPPFPATTPDPAPPPGRRRAADPALPSPRRTHEKDR